MSGKKRKLKIEHDNERGWYLIHGYGSHPQMVRENIIKYWIRRVLKKLKIK